MFKKTLVVLALVMPYFTVGLISPVLSEELDSTNFKIIDPTTSAGGGGVESTNYGILGSISDSSGDRITSSSYRIGTGFPEGIQANVPSIICAETNTTSGTTNCNDFPNGNGAIGECGAPGCYSTAKIEIDPSGNPVDSLYLVVITDTTDSTIYYLQSDHTIAETYDINDYLDLCSIQGKDLRSESNCTNSGEGGWDIDLQSQNIFGLTPSTSYDIGIRALNGDFTEGELSSVSSITTETITLSFDLDIGPLSSADTTAPHSINFGTLSSASVVDATDFIWLDVSTNSRNGISLFVKDQNNGLYNGTETIPSTTEDLSVDAGGDGGFGLRVISTTENSLGPLLEQSPYDDTGDNIGAVSTSNTLLISTTLGSGNSGAITAGRAGIALKARSSSVNQGGVYSDTLTFTLVPNL